MASLMLVNPRRRRKMSAKQRKYFGNPHRRHKHVRRHRHHYRHNPSLGNITGSIKPTLMGGLIGAAGGIGVDVVYGLLTSSVSAVPTFAANPAVATAGKLATSIIVGILGNMLLKGRGGALAIGGATVAIHDFAKTQLQAAMPSLPLGDYLTAAPTVGTRGGRFALNRGWSGVGKFVTGRGASVRRVMSQPVRGSRGAMGQYLSDSNFANGIPLT